MSAARWVPEPGAPLTPVELRILRMLAAGHTYVTIAAEFGRSERTMNRSGQRVYRKLGARTQAHAVALGYAFGLLTIGDATAGSTS